MLILLIPLIFGAIELSRGVAIRAALDSGTGVAVRALALDNRSSQVSWAEGVIRSTVQNNVMGFNLATPISITYQDYAGSPISITSLSFGQPFCVVASAPFTPDIPLIADQAVTIRVRHCGIIERVD